MFATHHLFISYACTHACAHACVRKCVQLHPYLLFACTHECVHAFIHPSMRKIIDAVMRPCTHARTHSCKHAFMHSNTRALMLLCASYIRQMYWIIQLYSACVCTFYLACLWACERVCLRACILACLRARVHTCIHTYKVVQPFVQCKSNCRVLQQNGMPIGSVYHGYTYIQYCFTLCAMQHELSCVATKRHEIR